MNLRAAAAVTAVVGLALAGMQVPVQAAEVFTVTMAPGTSVATLEQAQNKIRAAKPTTDVVVRIKQGTYPTDPKTEWTTYVPGHTISFLPVGYTPGKSAKGIARPVFVNARRPGKVDGPWFRARKVTTDAKKDLGGLRFYHLEVRGYQGGIALDGGTRKAAVKGQQRKEYKKNGAGLNTNVVEGMVFSRLGGLHTRGKYGYGALILTNSSNNVIQNNTFTGVENRAPHGPKIHGVYVTHFSSGNQILGNTFTRISGDPVKLRDRSNSNTITGNTFTRAGHYSYYREEFCTGPCLVKNPKKDLECASSGNRFIPTKGSSGYKGRSLPTSTLEPKSNKDKGPAGCPKLVNGYRVTGKAT